MEAHNSYNKKLRIAHKTRGEKRTPLDNHPHIKVTFKKIPCAFTIKKNGRAKLFPFTKLVLVPNISNKLSKDMFSSKT